MRLDADSIDFGFPQTSQHNQHMLFLPIPFPMYTILDFLKYDGVIIRAAAAPPPSPIIQKPVCEAKEAHP